MNPSMTRCVSGSSVAPETPLQNGSNDSPLVYGAGRKPPKTDISKGLVALHPGSLYKGFTQILEKLLFHTQPFHTASCLLLELRGQKLRLVVNWGNVYCYERIRYPTGKEAFALLCDKKGHSFDCDDSSGEAFNGTLIRESIEFQATDVEKFSC